MASVSSEQRILKRLHAVTFIFAILVTSNTWAGGLFFSEYATTASVGTAGVGGITNTTTAEAGVTNPAGLVGLKTNQLQLGLQIVDLTAEFKSTSPTVGKKDGGSTELVPAVFYAYRLNDNIVLGTSFHAAGALSFDYGSDWAGKNFLNDVEFAFLNLTGSIGYRVNDQFAIGGALVIQQFSLDLSTTVPPLRPSGTERKQSSDGDDVTPGFNLGLMYDLSDDTRIGFHYTSKIEHELDMDWDSARFPLLDKFLSGNFDLKITTPASYTLGGSHQLDQQWRLMARLAYEQWSDFGELTAKTDIGTIDGNMNLEDIYDIGIAAEYRTPAWTVYTGISYQEAIVSEEDRLISLPADKSWKLGVGGEWALGNDSYFGLAYELVLIDEAKLSQSNIRGTRTLEGKMSDYYIQFLSASYRY
ncbi:outer membrane protein transport protein [Photobacterium sagamiensis]|uniref:OmpP1/FadL family transporter n=1 Tax=Photobacterium sagamiensis TaxID=2910241 RepID=UPI003D0DBC92